MQGFPADVSDDFDIMTESASTGSPLPEKDGLAMQETILLIIATAVLTAILTVGLMALYYHKYLNREIDRKLDHAAEEMEARVKQGVLSAGEELLPQFRDKVTEGFLRALSDWPSSEFTKVAKTGASLVEEGLSTIFGKRRE